MSKPRVITEADYEKPKKRGVGDEVYLYLMTDDDGYTGVAYYERASGSRVQLIADSRVAAELMRSMAQKLAETVGRPVTLARFRTRENLDRLEP